MQSQCMTFIIQISAFELLKNTTMVSSKEIDFLLETGGGERDRTDDPLLAKQVLSQLSYTPRVNSSSGGSGWIRTNDPRLIKTVL